MTRKRHGIAMATSKKGKGTEESVAFAMDRLWSISYLVCWVICISEGSPSVSTEKEMYYTDETIVVLFRFR